MHKIGCYRKVTTMKRLKVRYCFTFQNLKTDCYSEMDIVGRWPFVSVQQYIICQDFRFHVWVIIINMLFLLQGQLLVNGINIGRYWPKKGPQVRLYVPKFFLHKGLNEVVMLELEEAPCATAKNCTIQFMDHPLINGTVIPNEDFIPNKNLPEISDEFYRHLFH